MNSPAEEECEHAATRFVVKHSGTSDQDQWEITEVCGEEDCGVVKGDTARRESRRCARRAALKMAQKKADDVGHAVEVRVIPKSKWSTSSFDVKWPKSRSTGLIRLAQLPPWLIVPFVLIASAAALYILFQLDSDTSEESDWANAIITALTVVASIVIAAAFTVASRIASDHDGPWVARRDILTRAAGLAVWGTFVLLATFVAAFFPYELVRYCAFAGSIVVLAMMLWELVQTPRRLTKYAAERRNHA